MAYAGAEFWDPFFRRRRLSGADLDWGGVWTEPFRIPLSDAGAVTILELGSGTGNDAARLARDGYTVTAIDLSSEAIAQARAKFGTLVRFLVADMARRLPFPDASFDAVMSNVALHMFPDDVTRAVFAEVGRLVRAGGLFLCLRELLSGWRDLEIASVPIPHRETGELYKHVWRGIAVR